MALRRPHRQQGPPFPTDGMGARLTPAGRSLPTQTPEGATKPHTQSQFQCSFLISFPVVSLQGNATTVAVPAAWPGGTLSLLRAGAPPSPTAKYYTITLNYFRNFIVRKYPQESP